MEHPEVALMTDLVKLMVVNEEEVTLVRTQDEKGVLLSLKVNPTDMGRVVGRSGATAQAIRLLLRVIGAKQKAVISLKVLEPGEALPSPF